MIVQNIIDGLSIIEKYKPDDHSDYHVRAEHDTIWAGSLDWKMSNRDYNHMIELGWKQDSESDGWMAYV